MKLRDKLQRLHMPGAPREQAPSRDVSRGLTPDEPRNIGVDASKAEPRLEREPDAALLDMQSDFAADEPSLRTSLREPVTLGSLVQSQRPADAATSSSSAPSAAAASPEHERLSTIRNLRGRLDAMRVSPTHSSETARSRPFGESPARRAPQVPGSPQPGDARAATLQALASLIAVPHAVHASGPLVRVAPRPESVVPAPRTETPLGPLYSVVVTHDEDHHHGTAPVVLGCRVCPREVALLALDTTLACIDFSRALYIDTETTGLAGGTGTLPFLIGMAWFEGERLVVEQLLLQRPGLEGPMLARLSERLALASVIVSYNGKSFDWPLLRTRFILNRIKAPALPAHLDLLHCARRVYKSRLGSVRLIHLEQALMGFERVDDIPGELIPETYLSFLRGSSPGSVLTPIVDHNRSDLIALPALLGEIVTRFSGGHVRQDARDQLGFARVLARGLAPDRAIAFAHAAVESDLRGELAATALFLVGELKQRQADVEGALTAFEGSLEASVSSFDRARAHHALAKLHEHKTKQCARALEHARETSAFEGEEASARRVERLSARLARSVPGKRKGPRRETNSATP